MENWKLVAQMDVKNAFLHGDLQEDVYMTLPKGYASIGSRVNVQQEEQRGPEGQGQLVCKLNKSLYGIKQAPRNWFSKLSTALISHRFHQSKSDHTLFLKNKGSTIVIVLMYVDDWILAGNSTKELEDTKHFLSSSFHMKDLGELRYFLGIEVDRSSQGIFLSQRKYTLDILKEYGMLNARKLKVQMDSTVKLTADQGGPLPDPVAYQKLTGKLLYLTLTRPDVAYSVHILSQFMQAPTTAHIQAARRVLRYLANSPEQGILLA
ncbi:Retrovirus-related Pol polyprotein from transposon RE2 [Bienertia sinuspersici]